MEVAAFVLAILSAAFSLVTYFVSVKHDKKQDTIEAFSRLQNEALDKLYYFTPSEIKEIAKDNRSEKFKEISLYLARIEHFSVGVNSKLYDQKTAYRLAGEMFHPIYEKLLPIIETKRKIPGSEKVFDDFEAFVKNLSRE